MEWQHIKQVYFLGIGGIGMSALARWFRANDYPVVGYDRSASKLTKQLQQEGMQIHFDDHPQNIPENYRDAAEKTLVIYTPAIPEDCQEMQYFQENGYQIEKRAKVLGRISEQYFTIAVAGTHGKTTTSSMIAHLLYQAGRSCTAFLGGILQNYGSNLLLQAPQSPDMLVVLEADEYDRSFLHLQPNIAVITSIEPDHLDIYGDAEQVKSSFQAFTQKIRPKGRLFTKKEVVLNLNFKNINYKVEEYALSTETANYAQNIEIKEGRFCFDFKHKNQSIKGIKLSVPGFHNVENAVAALRVGLALGLNEQQLHEGISTYKGVERRFEYHLQSSNTVFIDDYAHHPTEVRALLESVRALYPERQIVAVFQPHLYSRTRDFAEGFAESLSLADEVLLLAIYPAREKAIPGVSSKMILDKINLDKKHILSKQDCLNHLAAYRERNSVVLTIGAGDIAEIIPDIKRVLTDE